MTQADARKQSEYILFLWYLITSCRLRWEIVANELWTWFPYESPALRAAGFEDAFIVAKIPLETP